MGNYRFRLSDMMPNAWFYKLKDMSQRAKKNRCTPFSTGTSGEASRAAATAATPPLHTKLVPNRTSCYLSSRRAEAERFAFSPTHSKAMDTHFPLESPRKSKRRSRRKPIRSPVVKPKLVTSPVYSGCSCRVWKADSMMPAADFSAVASPDTPPCQRDYYIDGENLPSHKINLEDQQSEYDDLASWPRYCSCRLTSSTTDIIIDIGCNKNSIARKLEKLGEFDSASELKLPPVITKPASQESETTEFEDKNVVDHKVSLPKEQMNKSQGNKSSPGLQRLRTPAISPRLASRKVQTHRSRKAMQQRKNLSASFAVVKSSSDPRRDFRDSMLEMIAENNIRAAKDLEELLACYLSLNSIEYHDVIVKVFEQIWFDLTDNKF